MLHLRWRSRTRNRKSTSAEDARIFLLLAGSKRQRIDCFVLNRASDVTEFLPRRFFCAVCRLVLGHPFPQIALKSKCEVFIDVCNFVSLLFREEGIPLIRCRHKLFICFQALSDVSLLLSRVENCEAEPTMPNFVMTSIQRAEGNALTN